MMLVLLLLLMAYSLVGETVHEWLGTAMGILFIGHHALNLRWYRGLKKGRWGAARIYQTAVNFALLLTVPGSLFSEVILSRQVFALLPVLGGNSFAHL